MLLSPQELDRRWYRSFFQSFLMSTAFQSAIVVVLFTAVSNHSVQEKVKQAVTLVMPADLLMPPLPAKPRPISGGGGGGDRSPLPASKGRLPKAALRQFTPPAVVLPNLNARLTMEPSIIAPPDVPMPTVN